MAFAFSQPVFLSASRTELAFVGAQRRQPAAPTCGSGGPARPAHCRHSHIRGHTVCISKISTDTGAPENSLRPQGFGEGPARCFQYYILAGNQRLLEKPPGPWPPASWGGSQNPSWRSLTLEPALLPTYRPPPQGNGGNFLPEQLLGRRGLGSIFQARGGANGALTATPAPLCGFGSFPPKSIAKCAEARFPAERNNLNLLRGAFPATEPADLSAGGIRKWRNVRMGPRNRRHGSVGTSRVRFLPRTRLHRSSEPRQEKPSQCP